MKSLAWKNGNICDIAEAKVPLEDRCYFFGDGVYEVIKVYNGKPFYMAPHLKRLQNSAGAIEINIPYTIEEIEYHITDLIQKSGCQNGYLYMQLTRGCAQRDHLPPAGLEPSLIMYIREFGGPASVLDNFKPAGCITVPDERWLKCNIKSVNLLPNILARLKADKAGATEAIFYRPGGIVTEATRTNVFAVIDGKVRTHPESNLILSGITRSIVLDIMRKQDIPFSEEAFYVDDLKHASEVWTTSSGIEVHPIGSIDGRPVNEPVPGPICQQLIVEFRKIIKEECYDGKKA